MRSHGFGSCLSVLRDHITTGCRCPCAHALQQISACAPALKQRHLVTLQHRAHHLGAHEDALVAHGDGGVVVRVRGGIEHGHVPHRDVQRLPRLARHLDAAIAAKDGHLRAARSETGAPRPVRWGASPQAGAASSRTSAAHMDDELAALSSRLRARCCRWRRVCAPCTRASGGACRPPGAQTWRRHRATRSSRPASAERGPPRRLGPAAHRGWALARCGGGMRRAPGRPARSIAAGTSQAGGARRPASTGHRESANICSAGELLDRPLTRRRCMFGAHRT